MSYSEFRSYSPLYDAEVIRVSMADKLGREFFHIIPALDGKRYRERLEEALELIESAISQGCEPGEVVRA